MSSLASAAPGNYLRVSLWLAQVLVALIFVASGLTKLFMPMPELAAMMRWPGEYPAAFARCIGLIDLAGGLGILLPSALRIRPRLTVLAALGCVVLQGLAIGFHSSRGEWTVLPLNAVLLPLCVFVLWGRGKRLPVMPRGGAGR